MAKKADDKKQDEASLAAKEHLAKEEHKRLVILANRRKMKVKQAVEGHARQ